MKTTPLIAALALFPLLQGCSDVTFFGIGYRSVSGSGTVVTEERNVSDFDRVTVGGSGDVKLIQGDEESLTIVTDDNLLPLIRAEVSDGRLRIGPHNVSLRPTQGIHYTLRFKTLDELRLSGENCTPGSVREAPGDRRPYLDLRIRFV